MRRLTLFASGALFLLLVPRAHAAQMFRFDLQSLAFMSSGVIEGDVVDHQDVHYVDKLTVKVTRVYGGDAKAGDSVVVGLSAYRKAGKDAFDFQRFGILFVQPVTQRSWKEDQIPYWPAPSGLKLIADGKVTGIEQQGNPGPYINAIDEGSAKEYPAKVAEAVKWAAAFKQDLEKKRQDQAWLLEQLKGRPEIKPEMWGVRDHIAVTLCQAIADLGDPAAVAKAKEIHTDRYEQQVLSLPPRTAKDQKPEPQ